MNGAVGVPQWVDKGLLTGTMSLQVHRACQHFLPGLALVQWQRLAAAPQRLRLHRCRASSEVAPQRHSGPPKRCPTWAPCLEHHSIGQAQVRCNHLLCLSLKNKSERR